MPTKSKISIAERLTAAQLAIDNSLADAQIQDLVSAYGYSAEKLAVGKTLYDAALAAYSHAQGAAGAQQLATAHLKSTGKIARDAFQALAQVARAVFSDTPDHLVALGLDNPMPSTTAGFLNHATMMFDNAQSVSEIQSMLAQYGYTIEKLQTECAKIVDYNQANQSQEAAKGTAQQATVIQNKALAELDSWMARYIKIAKVALRHDKQLLEKIGIVARTSKRTAPHAASTQIQTSD